MDDNHVIGKEGEIPWSLPADREHYKNTISGSPVIIGRKTAARKEGEIKPRTDNINIVLTRKNLDIEYKNIVTAGSIDECLEKCRRLFNRHQTVFVLGGAQVYEAMLPYCQEIIVTHVYGEYEGDSYFPEILEDFKPTRKEEKDKFEVIWYERS